MCADGWVCGPVSEIEQAERVPGGVVGMRVEANANNLTSELSLPFPPVACVDLRYFHAAPSNHIYPQRTSPA
jgi:hypothetical protein